MTANIWRADPPQVASKLWYKSGWSEAPLCALVTKRNGFDVNIMIFDDGHGILTDGVGLMSHRNIDVYDTDALTRAEWLDAWRELPIGACMFPGVLP